MTGFYERKILPLLIDSACSQPPMTNLRSRYVSQAAGKVLEIGIGSGLNLSHYGCAVESIIGPTLDECQTVICTSTAVLFS